jgi:phage terminase large subunit-like protein
MAQGSRFRTETSLRVQILEELEARKGARVRLLDFLKFVWWKPWPFLIGRHTRAICARLDKAVDDYLAGISTNLLIAVPFRHGKSDIVSRAFPVYFLARCIAAGRDPDMILTGYGDALIQGFSKDAQNILESNPFQILFPGLRLSPRDRSVHSWQIDGHTGRTTATGLGGSLVGKGGDLIDCDDYCKNREEARSKTYRDKTWGHVQDMISRRAPVSIVLITATPWHVDDIRGRIKRAMVEDPDFPKFEDLVFPAKNRGADGRPDGTYLFEERFPAAWYRAQYASQGSFAPALLDCDPQTEGGNLFDVTKIDWRDSLEGFPNAIADGSGGWTVRGYRRGWDLASSEKQRSSDDPDWTMGVLGYVTQKTEIVQGLHMKSLDVWIADMAYIRAEAPKRDRMILETCVHDGRGVSHHVEDFGAYKDAYTTLKKLLSGIVYIERSHLPGDKVAKVGSVGLEAPFDAGRIHVLRGPWAGEWLKHFREFPDGTHDDAVDATVVMVDAWTKGSAGIASPEMNPFGRS